MNNIVCLVTVNVKKKNYGITAESLSAIAPNIPMGLLDAYLESVGIEVVVIDSDRDNLEVEELIQKIIEIDPAVVGVVASGSNPSASTMSMVGVLMFFDKVKQFQGFNYTTFVYGGHPTVLPQRTLDETDADFVVIGEGYSSIEGIYNHKVKTQSLADIPGVAYYDQFRTFKSHKSDPLVNLDDLPPINFSKMNPNKYVAHNWHCFDDIENRSPYGIIWTNLGCPYPCEFCCINNVFETRTFRFRSMKKVVEDIDRLVQDYGVRNIKILDELFIIKHPRIDEFCDLLEERNYDLNMWCFARVDSVTPRILKRLKKVGLNWVAYGFETIDDEMLAATNKRLKDIASVEETIKMTRDADINICADAIIGLPDDDRYSVQKTKDFLIKNEFEWVNLYPAFAYPGTPWYDDSIRDGIIPIPKKWDTYGLYSYDCEPMPTKHLTSAQVLELRDQVFSDYYKDPKILKMLERKFGRKTREHVEDLVSVKLDRKIITNA